jgi:hypothetical protein
MKENKLTIRINKPISEVFDFTINPKNTSLWLESIVEEKIDADEIKLGVLYINKDKDGNMNTYKLVSFEKNKIFELKSTSSFYSVRYTYKPISENETELEYFEWVEQGELEALLLMSTMQRLKDVLEHENI